MNTFRETDEYIRLPFHRPSPPRRGNRQVCRPYRRFPPSVTGSSPSIFLVCVNHSFRTQFKQNYRWSVRLIPSFCCSSSKSLLSIWQITMFLCTTSADKGFALFRLWKFRPSSQQLWARRFPLSGDQGALPRLQAGRRLALNVWLFLPRRAHKAAR